MVEKGDGMRNGFGRDILIQAVDPHEAAEFYVKQLGLTVTSDTPMVELRGECINLYIDQGPRLGPVLEIFTLSVEETRDRLVEQGCTIVKEDPNVPCCYVRDPFGLIYNLSRSS